MLNKVTITGADDSTPPSVLVDLSDKFPFVEWGILVSGSQVGSPRFPSYGWLTQLATLTTSNKINMSAHICGKWVREICNGQWGNWFAQMRNHSVSPYMFDRIQLNFHAYEHLLAPNFFDLATKFIGGSGIQVIFQCDGTNDHLIGEALVAGLNAAPTLAVISHPTLNDEP